MSIQERDYGEIWGEHVGKWQSFYTVKAIKMLYLLSVLGSWLFLLLNFIVHDDEDFSWGVCSVIGVTVFCVLFGSIFGVLLATAVLIGSYVIGLPVTLVTAGVALQNEPERLRLAKLEADRHETERQRMAAESERRERERAERHEREKKDRLDREERERIQRRREREARERREREEKEQREAAEAAYEDRLEAWQQSGEAEQFIESYGDQWTDARMPELLAAMRTSVYWPLNEQDVADHALLVARQIRNRPRPSKEEQLAEANIESFVSLVAGRVSDDIEAVGDEEDVRRLDAFLYGNDREEGILDKLGRLKQQRDWHGVDRAVMEAAGRLHGMSPVDRALLHVGLEREDIGLAALKLTRRKLAKKYHPDRNRDAHPDEFIAMNAACELLEAFARKKNLP